MTPPSHGPAGPRDSTIVPGALVRHPAMPDWGIGQVQSVVGGRVTANFETAGKRVIDNDIVRLETVADERDF